MNIKHSRLLFFQAQLAGSGSAHISKVHTPLELPECVPYRQANKLPQAPRKMAKHTSGTMEKQMVRDGWA
ncbi:hypothetical protein AB4144_58960, partial [Rhizobiaceae sp. 2RAB30]